MTETKGVVIELVEQPGPRRLLEIGDHLQLGHPPGHRHLPHVEVQTCDGSHPEGLVHLTGQAGQPATDGQVEIGAAAGVADRRLHQQGVPGRLDQDPLHIGAARHQATDAGLVEALETDDRADDPVVERGDHVGQVRVLVGVGVPSRDHHGERTRPGTLDEVLEQLHRRLVGPVHVIEDEHGRSRRGQRPQPPGHGLEQAVPLGVGVADRRATRLRARGPARRATARGGRAPPPPARGRSADGSDASCRWLRSAPRNGS